VTRVFTIRITRPQKIQRPSRIFVVVCLVLVLSFSLGYGLSIAQADSWTTKQNLPSPKADCTAAVYGGKLYVFGGYSDQGPGDARRETYAYDPSADSWEVKANMPTARWGLVAVEYGGKIYVFGGTANVNEVYDPVANSWTSKRGLPSGFNQGLMAVAYGSTIQLFYHSLHYEYNPATDTYVVKASMPSPTRRWATVATVGNRIFVIGGFYDSGRTWGPSNVNAAYDPSTDSWAVKASVPTSKFGATRENPVINGKIIVTHGLGDYGFRADNYVYDPASDSWQQQASAAHARDGVACGVINGKLYVVGGRADFTGPYGLRYTEEYTPSTSPSPPASPTPPAPPAQQPVTVTITFEPFGVVMTYALPNGVFTAPSKITLWQTNYRFAHWSDGSTTQTRTFNTDGSFSIVYT
jgi:N-acetylneuraminic acid mutarotase